VQLNAVARHAEVGVGTVYRHFPTPDALVEGLAEARFVELAETARQAITNPQPLDGLLQFLRRAFRAYTDDPAFAEASVNPAPSREETRIVRAQLLDHFAVLVERASPHLRPGLDAADLMNLVCGCAYAARLRPRRASAYLETLVRGMTSAAE
jgi:AcrR family transcriptional regulator